MSLGGEKDGQWTGLDRVGAVHVLQVDVWPRSIAGGCQLTHSLALCHWVAGRDLHGSGLEVGQAGVHAFTVIDHHVITKGPTQIGAGIGGPDTRSESLIPSTTGGEAIFGSSVARRVLARLTAPPPERDPFPQLTPREHDVLDLLACGLSNPAIAARLELSLKTINNLTSSVFAKLHVAGRTEAALLARDHGLGRS